jgi:hypothetical protein
MVFSDGFDSCCCSHGTALSSRRFLHRFARHPRISLLALRDNIPEARDRRRWLHDLRLQTTKTPMQRNQQPLKNRLLPLPIDRKVHEIPRQHRKPPKSLQHHIHYPNSVARYNLLRHAASIKKLICDHNNCNKGNLIIN